jgi:hypothetical protein
MDRFTDKLNKINTYFSSIKDLASKDILNSVDRLTIINDILNKQDKCNNVLLPYQSAPRETFSEYTNYKYPFYNYESKVEKDYMSKFYMYRLLLKINKLKFNDTFLSKLIYLVNKIYKKKIELKIVNLKKMHLNSDIYTQAVSLKLRNKDNRLYRILKASLRKIKLPTIRKVSEKQTKPNKNEFLVNKIRNNIISFMFRGDNTKDPLGNLLLRFYPLADNIKVKKLPAYTAHTHKEEEGINNLRSISLTSYVRR